MDGLWLESVTRSMIFKCIFDADVVGAHVGYILAKTLLVAFCRLRHVSFWSEIDAVALDRPKYAY